MGILRHTVFICLHGSEFMDYKTTDKGARALNNGTALRECTLRVGPFVNLPKLLLDLGCDPDPVFETTGISQNELGDPEHRISYLAGSHLLAECVAVTGCEHFGLLLGQMACPSHLGMAGFLVRTASTVEQALRALVENLDLHDQGGTCTLDIDSGYSQLSFRVHQPGVMAIAQIYDLSAVLLCKIMRSLCGEGWNASQVLLVRSKPHDLTPYSNFFRTGVYFDSDTCGILFPSHYLRLKPPTADELLYHHLELEASVLHQMQHHEVVEMLPAVLQRGLLLDQCSASDIADAFGMQERTLHRRLQSAGTSFREELDRVREALSIQLLESSSLPICDIATSLGYADSSGFIRAFQRWTGSSPAFWRKQNRIQVAAACFPD